MRLSKRVATVVGIAAAIAVMAPGSAHAATGGAAVAVVGSGTIQPGLTATPTHQNVEFTGTAAGAAFAVSPTVADAGAVTCHFTGSSGPVNVRVANSTTTTPYLHSGVNETSAGGTGNVTGTCTGTGVLGNDVKATCELSYVRVGPLVVVQGECTVEGGGATVHDSTTAGVFVFVPGVGVTTTSYQLVGAALGAGVN